MVVGDGLGEGSLHDEVSGLLVQVLVEVRSQDDVHDGSLTDLIVSQARQLVGFEHQWSDLMEHSLFLIHDRYQVKSLGCKMV